MDYDLIFRVGIFVFSLSFLVFSLAVLGFTVWGIIALIRWVASGNLQPTISRMFSRENRSGIMEISDEDSWRIDREYERYR